MVDLFFKFLISFEITVTAVSSSFTRKSTVSMQRFACHFNTMKRQQQRQQQKLSLSLEKMESSIENKLSLSEAKSDDFLEDETHR
jgi:hypothetical protein